MTGKFFFTLLPFILGAIFCEAKTYYLSNSAGNDGNDGSTPSTAWKSLEKASQIVFGPGDTLLLKKDDVFMGKLMIQGQGKSDQPIYIGSYGNGEMPVIDGKGWRAAIHLRNGKFIRVANLELVADGGDVHEDEAIKHRYGVLMEFENAGAYGDITLKNLSIHHIFSTIQTPRGGQNSTSNLGVGVEIRVNDQNASVKNIKITGCTIEMTGFTGINIIGHLSAQGSIPNFIRNMELSDNRLRNIGGPGIVPRVVKSLVVRNNVVNGSGSSVDPRMHARGSGIWPWHCEDVLIEKNKFMHARGKADSCGMHIDFDCKNVIVQYNLSYDNAGGFIEILGNNYNCSYRYNISINDGFRIKGQNKAEQEGKVLWTSGWVGRNKQKKGPFNSYVYNNTVYVKEDILTRFSIASTTKGLLVANNIFYILGDTKNVSSDQDNRTDDIHAKIEDVLFTNNVYARAKTLPGSFSFSDTNEIVADLKFKNPQGFLPSEFVPTNVASIRNKSIKLKKLPKDSIGLKAGFSVKHDFFGNPIKGTPDIGAIEIQD